jgi:hypothetical protein
MLGGEEHLWIERLGAQQCRGTLNSSAGPDGVFGSVRVLISRSFDLKRYEQNSGFT